MYDAGVCGWITYAPIPVVPERVSGLLSDVDIDRVRTGNPPSLTGIENVRGWQDFHPTPRGFNSRERDLEIDALWTLHMVPRLLPKRKGLSHENF